MAGTSHGQSTRVMRCDRRGAGDRQGVCVDVVQTRADPSRRLLLVMGRQLLVVPGHLGLDVGDPGALVVRGDMRLLLPTRVVLRFLQQP